jgi:hypothetical protein
MPNAQLRGAILPEWRGSGRPISARGGVLGLDFGVMVSEESRFLTWGIVLVSAAFVGCGSSDKSRVVPDDAASGGGVSSSGGSGGKGSGGAPGAGGASAGGSRGSSGSGGTKLDAGKEASIAPREGGPPDAAGLVCSSDGGDAGNEWRDFTAGTCNRCPATLPLCPDLVATPATFDRTTRVLVFHLTPGLDELRSANFTGGFLVITKDGGTRADVDVPVVVNENTLTIDLSSQVPRSFVQFDGGVLHFTDACGQTASTNQRNDDIQIVITPGEGGVPVVSVSCYANV